MRKYVLIELSELTENESLKNKTIEVEEIIRGLTIHKTLLGREEYFAILSPNLQNKLVLPVYGSVDSSKQAKSKISMLKFSSETDTPVKVRGVLKLPNRYAPYIKTEKGRPLILRIKTVKLEKWESILWDE